MNYTPRTLEEILAGVEVKLETAMCKIIKL